MSLGIAFQGCGCRLAFHVGAVQALLDRGYAPAALSGASSGSVVAAAAGLGRVTEMRRSWESRLDETRLFQPRRLLQRRWPFTMSDIVGDALDAELGQQRLADFPLPLAIVVTQLGLRGPTRRVLTREDDLPLQDAILASSFVPGPYTRMIRIDGRVTVDGAWQVRTPIHEAHALGATHVVGCVTNPAGRLLGGLVRERPVEDTPPWARVLAPLEQFPLGTLDFDPGRTRAARDLGRRSAEAFVREHRDWLEDATSTP